MILGLITSYREGSLIQGAVRSLLTACDHVVVCDGPVGEPITSGEPSELGRFGKDTRLTQIKREGETDADKRNRILEWVRGQRHFVRPVWGLWLDADEVLAWPEQVRAYVDNAPADVVAIPIPKVELSGTTMMAHGRLMRLDLTERYVMGSYQVQFIGQKTIVTLPDIPPEFPKGLRDAEEILNKGVWDFGSGSAQLAGALKRIVEYLSFVQSAPHGTPQILQLAPLRQGERAEARLHKAEVEWTKERVEALGLTMAPFRDESFEG